MLRHHQRRWPAHDVEEGLPLPRHRERHGASLSSTALLARAKSRSPRDHKSITFVPEEVERSACRVSERRSRCGYSTLRSPEVASAFRVVEASLELTGMRRQRRELALRPTVYVTSPFKKGRAEVSERQLTTEQLVQLPPLLVLLADYNSILAGAPTAPGPAIIVYSH